MLQKNICSDIITFIMTETDRFGAPDRMGRSIFDKLKTSSAPTLLRRLGDIRFFMEHATEEGLVGQVFFRTQIEFLPILRQVSRYRRELARQVAKGPDAKLPKRIVLREVLGLQQADTPIKRIDERKLLFSLPMVDDTLEE